MRNNSAPVLPTKGTFNFSSCSPYASAMTTIGFTGPPLSVARHDLGDLREHRLSVLARPVRYQYPNPGVDALLIPLPPCGRNGEVDPTRLVELINPPLGLIGDIQRMLDRSVFQTPGLFEFIWKNIVESGDNAEGELREWGLLLTALVIPRRSCNNRLISPTR